MARNGGPSFLRDNFFLWRKPGKLRLQFVEEFPFYNPEYLSCPFVINMQFVVVPDEKISRFDCHLAHRILVKYQDSFLQPAI